MRSIGIVTTSLSRKAGGLFHSVRRSALALSEAGADITVYGVEDDHTAEDIEAWGPLDPKVFPQLGPSPLGIGRGLARAVRYGGHDVIHLHGIWQYASVAAMGAGVPVMISPRGMLDPWAVANSGWKKKLAGWLFEYRNLRNAACMHALNAAEREGMRHFGLKAPIAEIPNGTDLPDLEHEAPRPGWLPDDGKKTLLFLGRIHPKKGLQELLAAWSVLSASHAEVTDKWRLVIAGWDDGGHEAGLKDYAKDAGIADVLFPGPLHGEEKDAALHHADAFILPSHSEGLPMAVLEAWAYGLPVFMTDACNLPIGFDEGAAWRVEAAPDALAGELQAGLSKPDISGMGVKGRKLAAERFAWAPIARQHIEVYDWMVQGGPRPDCVDPGPELESKVSYSVSGR